MGRPIGTIEAFILLLTNLSLLAADMPEAPAAQPLIESKQPTTLVKISAPLRSGA